MNDLIIKVSKINKTILPDRTTLGNDGENLQSRLVFKFIDSFVDGIARLEYSIDDENNYIMMDKENNTYSIPIKNIITKEGNVLFQLVITEPETSEGIPLYKSDVFNLYCKESINAVDEAPEGYELWIDLANQKLMEMEEKIIEVDEAIEKTNNLNITVTKQGTITIIRLTDKDGHVHSVTVNDGATGNGIESITKTSTSGLVDTYTILYTNGDTTTFDVNNGRGITSIVKTSTEDNVDTYTITYNDGTTSTFTVTNGEVTEEQLEEAMQETLDRANMVYNALPKVTDTNTQLTLNSTANTPMELELNPSELTQETTTGKSLYDFINNTYTTEGTITVNKLSSGYTLVNNTSSEGRIMFSGVTVDSSKNYVISLEISNSSGVNVRLGWSGSGKMIGTTATSGKVAQTLSGITTSVFSIYCPANSTITITNLMVYEGTDTSIPFEPYTGGIPQPNPNYPSEVQVIKGNNSILIRSKNLFDKNDITSSNGYISDANGNFVSNSSQPTKASNYIYVKGIDKLHFSTNMTTNRWGAFYDENKTFISGFNFLQTNPLTVPANAYYMRTTVQISILDEFQVEIGESGTTYVAHQEQVLPLNLPNGMEYCKIGTYEDEFEHDGDKWYLNKKIGKVVLDGSEYWAKETQSNNTNFRSGLSSALGGDDSISCLSNYFIGVTGNQSYQGSIDNGIGIGSSKNLRIRSSYFSSYDATAFKNWLSTHNTTVYYVLSTPTHTEITDTTLINQLNAIEQAVSYDGQTNISQTNTQLPFIIKATAIRSLVNIFDLINGGA